MFACFPSFLLMLLMTMNEDSSEMDVISYWHWSARAAVVRVTLARCCPSCASSLAMTCCPRLLSRRDGLCAQILFWAEYCQDETALQGNVFNKQDPLEHHFQCFNQANTIFKSRDLGSIICNIKFSELTYLDTFWRDYINGSLLEARKGVFITDSLKQVVGHEAIKLLVNVDEEDYELGRKKLLRNLMLQALP